MIDPKATPIPGTLLAEAIAESWIARFIQIFRPPPRKYPNQKLPIPSNIPTACLLEGRVIYPDWSNLRLAHSLPVFAHFEGGAPEVYATTLGAVLAYLKKRQPWEYYDICLFDESLNWCLGISHNDTVTFVHKLAGQNHVS